ncbi:MAG: sulfite exporter TauE/SafE family protein [Thermoplasmata archaeon]|nr:sulfite exporter TauE/SafE family protein [Thermoplasmata archaeon]
MDVFPALWLALLALGAALVNGAVGYGFSSIVTPIAIFWYSNKVLNPALVTVELAVNLTLLVRERHYLRATWHRANGVITTLLPGVLLGTAGLTYLAVTDVKLAVYATLLPLVVIQLYGFSRPFRNERRSALAVGPGIGFLYALTTISGPPLAIFFRNQGLTKNEFRATMAQVRVGESSLTLATYVLFSYFFGAGLVSSPSANLLPFLIVPVVIGVPLGTLILHRVSPETFRRVVMAFDGLLVSYGFSRSIVSLNWATVNEGYVVMLVLFTLVAALAWWSLRKLSGTQWIIPSTSATLLQEPPDRGSSELGATATGESRR